MKATTPTTAEYQTRELATFYAAKHRFFDTTRDFAERLACMDIPEQIEWIENGSYGAGACLALQRALRTADAHPRTNRRAVVGAVVLQAFYGAPFRYWVKLPADLRDTINAAIDGFLARPHEFGMTLEA